MLLEPLHAVVDEPADDERIAQRQNPDHVGNTLARGKDQRWHEHQNRRTFDDRLAEAARMQGEEADR